MRRAIEKFTPRHTRKKAVATVSRQRVRLQANRRAERAFLQKEEQKPQSAEGANSFKTARDVPFWTKKEEQRHERTLIFCIKNQSKRYKACSDVERQRELTPIRNKEVTQ